MTEEEPIFGTEPDRLMRLMRSGLETDEPELDEGVVETAPAESLAEQTGKRIGRYKLLRMLGEGGMGIVYLAEQQGSIRRRVALKVIKPGMDSKRVLARFEAERQALALLDHPNIAHVYDSGTTEAGRPYFVMEHVKGLSITEHCDHYKLAIKERLQLFQQICHAVHHAHQKGIIHRDIKPSNILVSIHEDQAMPKIIDFGVAKALSQPLTERTLYTEQGQLFGTPEYMSPEQADMAVEDIDTRSDIYSLGVLLYELLTGALPFDSDTLRGGGIDNIRKVICETDPKTPSTRLTRLGAEAAKIAENRRTEIAALAKCLHRELEWIPLKAMRKERTERYRSASELADDVENYLDGNPLIAGPPTAAYRVRKFARRNQALVAGTVTVGIALMVGLIVSTALYLRAEDMRVAAQRASQQAEQAAEKEAYAGAQLANALAEQTRALEQSRALANFLNVDILRPFAAKSFKPVTIREVFDSAEEKLATRFEDYPLLEAEVRFTFGDIYTFQFADYDMAIANLERAVELEESERGPVNSKNKNWLGLTYQKAGRYQEAEVLFREMVESIEQERRIRPSGFYCAVKHHLAHTYQLMGRYDEAELHLRECPIPQLWEEGDWREFIYKGNLPNLLTLRGRYDEARRLYDVLMQRSRSVQKKEIGAIMIVKKNLGILHMLQGDPIEAASLLEEALEGARKAWREEHWRTVDFKIALAVLRTKEGRHNEAESLFDECLEDMQKRMKDDHPELLRVKNQLGVLYREQGRHDEAQKLLNDVLQRQAQSKELGPDHPHTLESMHELAVLYVKQDQHQQAADLLEKVAKGRLDKLSDKHPHTQESLSLLIDLYKTLNQPEEAERWRAKLAQRYQAEKQE